MFSDISYENGVIEIGSAEILRKADSREEIYNILGITSEMVEWVINNGQELNEYGDFKLYLDGNWSVSMLADSVDSIITPYLCIGNGAKYISLDFDTDNEKKLFSIIVDIM